MVIACVVFIGGESSGEEIAFLAQTGGYWQVWVMRSDGGEQRQVTHSDYEKSRVSWFPDGTRLVITSIDGRLVEVDAQSGREKPMTMPLQSIHDAAVSPDGNWMALAASTGGGRDNHDIWLVRPDGSEQRRLVSMPRLQHEPTWSRDGQWIYFLSGDGEQDHDIWRVRVSDGSTEQLTVNSRYHFDLDVAPNGSIAYSGNRTGDYEIYSIGPEGAEPLRWTTSPGMDGHPTWSPDGKALIFHSTRGGVLNLWRLDGANAPAQALTHFSGGARDPEWWGEAQ